MNDIMSQICNKLNVSQMVAENKLMCDKDI